jgi:hypothetical protein
MPRAILVHGFNVHDGGKRTVGTLRPYLERAGYDVRIFSYGWMGLVSVRLFNARFAQMMADLSNSDDLMIGHSNGCCLIHLAAQRRAPFRRVVYINPALDRAAPLAPQVGALDVWHSPSDKPVSWARFLPDHPWGDMGAWGYQGRHDPRIRNFNKESGFAQTSSREHSDVFTGERLRYFGPLIVQRIQEAAA